MNVLIAEDDEVLGTAIVKGLCENRHTCHWIKSGREVVPTVGPTRATWLCLICAS